MLTAGAEALRRDIRCPLNASRWLRSRSREGQRMQEDVSRLVGIEGLLVTCVDDVGACLVWAGRAG